MRLSWIRHLPSIIASSLLFGFIGTPLGTVVFLAGIGIADGKPLDGFRIFGDLILAAWLAVFFGAVPAFVTGLAAGILRVHVRSLSLLACLMAPIGAVVTAVYVYLALFRHRHAEPMIVWISLTGAVAAFCCTFLLWRNRPWLIPPR
jgi:hypothetical protein